MAGTLSSDGTMVNPLATTMLLNSIGGIIQSSNPAAIKLSQLADATKNPPPGISPDANTLLKMVNLKANSQLNSALQSSSDPNSQDQNSQDSSSNSTPINNIADFTNAVKGIPQNVTNAITNLPKNITGQMSQISSGISSSADQLRNVAGSISSEMSSALNSVSSLFD